MLPQRYEEKQERSDAGIRFPTFSLVMEVEAETPTVARGSGSEAVAESCGGTVLLTDNGTRERHLREKHKANSRWGSFVTSDKSAPP